MSMWDAEASDGLLTALTVV